MIMKNAVGIALCATLFLAGTAAHADTLTFNSAPNDAWSYGSGNNYTPSNTAVLTTEANNQLYLRLHQTFEPAAASDGSGVYSFALGTGPISFDWGIDGGFTGTGTDGKNGFTGGIPDGLAALITLTNIGTGQTFSYNPFYVGDDNVFANGSAQNSNRLRWDPWNWNPIDFDANVDNTYQVNLTVSGLSGGSKSLDVYAKLGAGAVPEPASWAMLVAGFGAIGLAMRKRVAVSFA